MIKLTQLIPEVVRLNSVKEIDPIKDELAAAAQQEYDDWIQDENDELNGGGICHLIAEKLKKYEAKNYRLLNTNINF
jgi:hypothetical protein